MSRLVLASNRVGDLSKGTGNTPTDWRTDKWDTSAGATEFLWKAPAGGEPGQAGIQNVKPNDARFVQDVRVKEQTWYHIHGKVRTKEVGEGTGLGLSMVHSIMESHGGRVELRSKKGEGTTAELVMPMHG